MKQDIKTLVRNSLGRYEANINLISHTRDLIRQKVPITEMDEEPLIQKRIIRLGKDRSLGKERLIGGNDLISISYLEHGVKVAKSVCRIIFQNNFGSFEPLGTGFLVSPQLIMTNHHIISDFETAESVIAQFNYEYDHDGQLKEFSSFRLAPKRFFISSHEDDLDYTLVAIEPISQKGHNIENFGWNKLIAATGKIVNGEALTIIQHPNGEPKQIALRENMLLGRDDKFLFYETDTNPGSSGAPVYNNQWEVVALHRSGVPKTDQDGNILTVDNKIYKPFMGEHKIKWVANEGVRISKIIEDINNRELTGPEEILRQEFNVTAGYTPTSPINIIASQTSIKNSNRLSKDSKEIRFEIQFIPSKVLKETAISELREKFGVDPEKVFNSIESDYNELQWFYELTLNISGNPWDVAHEILKTSGIQNVDIDLPSLTHTAPDDYLEANFIESNASSYSNQKEKEKNNKRLNPRWNHKATKFPEALDYFKGSEKKKSLKKVRVAQIDTGYSGHPEIANINYSDGYDFADYDDSPYDEFKAGKWRIRYPGHGTRTASVLIGNKTSLEGDQNDGVYTDVDYVPFRVANSPVLILRNKSVAKAVEYIINNKFDIITMSMGSIFNKSWKVLAEMAYSQGIFWICAAGNQIKFVVNPARYKGTIAVAATNCEDEAWNGSSRGRKVDIAAPGEDVFVPRASQDKDLVYNYGSGTSYATPHIAAAAALWLNFHGTQININYTQPWQRVEAFRHCLKLSSRKPKNWDPDKYGAGILNAFKLLKTPLPSANKLEHAYRKPRNLETIERDLSISEKEIIYKEWNREILGDQADQYSDQTKNLVKSILNQKKLKLEDGYAPVREYAFRIISELD